MNKYKLFYVMIFFSVFLFVFVINDDVSIKHDNYFWLPSAIMQSIAAVFALFIAVFVLSLQRHQRKISSVVDALRPPIEFVSRIIIITMYFNGLVIFIINFYNPSESKLKFLLFGSLVSLIMSLILIVFYSFRLLKNVAGLKTSDEKLDEIDQVNKTLPWKSEDEKKKIVEL
jgi:hypothetical protein